MLRKWEARTWELLDVTRAPAARPGRLNPQMYVCEHLRSHFERWSKERVEAGLSGGASAIGPGAETVIFSHGQQKKLYNFHPKVDHWGRRPGLRAKNQFFLEALSVAEGPIVVTGFHGAISGSGVSGPPPELTGGSTAL